MQSCSIEEVIMDGNIRISTLDVTIRVLQSVFSKYKMET